MNVDVTTAITSKATAATVVLTAAAPLRFRNTTLATWRSRPRARAREQDDGKVLYLGPDRAGNLLEIVSIERDDGSEIVIHAMPMCSKHEPFLRGEGTSDA